MKCDKFNQSYTNISPRNQLQALHKNQRHYLLNLQHQLLSISNGDMKAMLLSTTITVSAFGIRSMVNGNGIWLVNIMNL